MSPKKPQVAHIEDYDSDSGHVKVGSRVEARRGSTASAIPLTTAPIAAINRSTGKATARARTGAVVTKDAASDSGYSSHASSALASIGSVTAEQPRTVASLQTAARTSKPASPSKPRPAMPRVYTASSQPTSDRPMRTASPTKWMGECDNLLCQHATCQAIRYPQQQANVAAQPQPPPLYPAAHYMNGMPQHYQSQPQTPQFSYAQIPQLPPPSQGLAPGPRPRTGSMAGVQRPLSYHGHTFPGALNPHQGPPPSQSAYHNAHYLAQGQAWQQAYQQQMAQYQLPPPNQAIPMFSTSPHPASPIVAPRMAEGQRSYSARMTSAATPAPESVTRQPLQPQTQSSRAISARQYTSHMPGGFPGGQGEEEEEQEEEQEETSDSESTSSSSESSSSYESEPEAPRPRPTRRDSRQSISSAFTRRPSFRTRRTSEMPDQGASAREYVRRPRAIEAAPDHPSSSDNMDSDRTARAVVDRRISYNGSSRRRPSVSSNQVSRNRDVEIVTRSSRAAPSSDERYAARLAEIEQAERIRQLQREDHQNLLDKVAAYQNAIAGPPAPELTLDAIQQQNRRNRMSGSHASPTRRSSSSSNVRSRVQSPTSDGIKIEAGGTVLHIYGETNIEMRSGDDGGPRLVIGRNGSAPSTNPGSATVSNGDSAYAGSSQKSGSSRHGRSRGAGSSVGRRRDTVMDDGYSRR